MQAFIGNADKAAVNPALVKQDFIPLSKTESPKSSEVRSSDFSRMVSAAQKSSSSLSEEKPYDVSAENAADTSQTANTRKEDSPSKSIADKTETTVTQTDVQDVSTVETSETKENNRLAKKDAKKADNKKKTTKVNVHKTDESTKTAAAPLGTVNLLIAQTEQAAKIAKPNAADGKNADAAEFGKLSAKIDGENDFDTAETALESAQMLSFTAEAKKTEKEFASGSKKSGTRTERTEKKSSIHKGAKLTVTDLRTHKADDTASAKKLSAKGDLKAEIRYDGKNTAEMTLNLSDGIQQNLTSSNSQTASASSSTFQAMLANQIQNNAQDFVKAGNIVLKDNNAGQIKLILHPESLGSVKIDLDISDKTLSGRITVASQEAFNAFKESAESLRQAFVNSGFENAGFELAMAGNGQFGGNLSGDEQGANNAGRDFAAHKAYSEEGAAFESQQGDADDFVFSQANSINIVA